MKGGYRIDNLNEGSGFGHFSLRLAMEVSRQEFSDIASPRGSATLRRPNFLNIFKNNLFPTRLLPVASPAPPSATGDAAGPKYGTGPEMTVYRNIHSFIHFISSNKHSV